MRFEPTVPHARNSRNLNHYHHSCSHVLVPTSLSQRENTAIALGMELASGLNAKITLLHVLPTEEPPPEEQYPSASLFDAIDALHRAVEFSAAQQAHQVHATRKRLEEARQNLATHIQKRMRPHQGSLANVRLECSEGDVVKEVARFVAAEEVDLVILTSQLSWWRLPVVPQRLHQLLQELKKQVIVVRPEVQHQPVEPSVVPQ